MIAKARLSAVLGSLALLWSGAVATADTFLSIGTGSITGVYYPAGGAICRMINDTREQHGYRCSVESTDGSIYNLSTVRAGDINFGIAQSDWILHSHAGTSRFAEAGPFASLRTVFALHAEPFTLVARAESGIASFGDLEGKRVNIGNPGSGQRATMDVVLKAFGWDTSKFAEATELRPSDQVDALCDQQIDAMIFTVGHPSLAIQDALLGCDGMLVEVKGAGIDALVDPDGPYRHTRIPGGTYRTNPDDIETFGVRAVLVTSEAEDEDTVYALVKAVFENLVKVRRMHPAFADFEPDMMIGNVGPVPLHPGAVRYYRERGWM